MGEGIKYGCLGFVALVVILVVGFGIAVLTGLMRLPLMNIDRVVTQHSLQYVQTHQKVILDYYADYQLAPDDAHKNAAVLQLCAEANLLDSNEYPSQAAGFIYANCH